MTSGIVTRRRLAILIRAGQIAAVLAMGARDIAAQDAVPPPTRVITCPSGLKCAPAAIDGAGRLIVYTISTGSSLCCQIRVLDRSTNTDRVVWIPTGLSLISIRITDDGRYVLYRTALEVHAFDTSTGVTTDFPVVPGTAGVYYVATDWSRDLRLVLYGATRNLSTLDADRYVIYDRQSGTITDVPVHGRVNLSSGSMSADARVVGYSSLSSNNSVVPWLFEPATGRELLLSSPGAEARVENGLRFTPDGRYVTLLSSTYETATGRLVVGSPEGSTSPNGRYVAYRCSADFRETTFCLFDQVTRGTSRLPSVSDPRLDDNFRGTGATVDDLGRVAFNAGGADVYTTCGSYFLPPPQIWSSNLGVTADITLRVSSDQPCNWTARSNVPWITITSPPTGAGTSTITYVASTNATGRARTGTLTIAGQTFVVTQGQNAAAAPGAPVALRGPDTGVGMLTWGPPVDGGDVASYIIEGGSRPGLADRFRFSTNRETTYAPIAVSLFVNCCRLYMRVRASNAFGESLASNEVALHARGTGGCGFPPDAPDGFEAAVEGSTVTLRWRTPAGNLSGTEASFIIEAGSASGLANLANYVTGNTASSLLAPGIPAGTYFARVRAFNACGAGPASNELVVTVR